MLEHNVTYAQEKNIKINIEIALLRSQPRMIQSAQRIE